MRDSKAFYFMILALVLVTVSFVLVSIWGYHYYFRNESEKPVMTIKKQPEIQKKPLVDSLEVLNDSSTLLTNTQEENIEIISDSSDKTLELKMLEYNQLKEEIAEIQKNKAALKIKIEEMKKISEIQKNIDSLKEQKEAIIIENEKMDQLLKQKQQAQNKNKTEIEKRSKNLQASSLPLLVSHLTLEAIKETENYDAPTVLASKAAKLEVSFEINIISKKNISPEIFVKIIQPNGRPVLDVSSGLTVLEKGRGKSSYTEVLHFDKTKDDHKRVSFSTKPKEFYKGKYTMQIYHNGVMIGRTQRTLN